MAVMVLDTESSGRPNLPYARVVEVAAVALDPHDDYAVIGTFTSYLRAPEFDAAAENPGLAHNGIAVEDVLAAPGERAVRRALYDWMSEHNVTEVYAYNRPFDEAMLKRSGFVLPWAGCVMRMARAAMPSRKKDPPLFEAAEHFLREIPAGQPHRALPDAHLAALVFAAIRRAS